MVVIVGLMCFALGVFLTTLIALFVIGVLYREAVNVVDSYMGGFTLRSSPADARASAGEGIWHAND